MADIDSFAADSNATLIQSFSLLVNSLDHHANDLRDVSKLRCSPDGVDQTELVVLEKRIRTMEHTFKALRQHLKGESEAIKEVQNLQNVVNEQTDHIQKICGNLPQHLPQQNFGSSQAAPEPQRSVVDDSSNVENVEHVPSKPKGRTKTRRGRKSVTDRIPKLRYLTVDEFSSVPSYIRGRLSLNKVNSALNELQAIVHQKYELFDKNPRKLGARLKDVLMMYKEQETDETEGRFFVTERELRKANTCTMKSDTGRAIINTLRHCKRLLSVTDGGLTRYVLNGPL